MKKKILASFLILSFLFVGNLAYAAHYLSGQDSVDTGEIRWGGSTQFSTAWNSAISTWNSEGEINIAPDTIYTYQDLTILDFYSTDLYYYGYYDYDSVGSDEIGLNEYYLDGQSANRRQNTATHELGHSLGLAHSTVSNVMYYDQTTQTSLGSQDISDYNYLWQ